MQIYVLMPQTTDFPYVFVSKEDAEAFSRARWPEDEVDIEEQTIIDHTLARQMIAEERKERKDCSQDAFCLQPQDHVGQHSALREAFLSGES